MHRIRRVRSTYERAQIAGVRTALLAATFVFALIASIGANPYAANASALQLHGALSRADDFGIIAHRGAAAIAPENTLAAMRLSFERGVDFVEADLHLSADGVPVLMHDPTVDRTTNGTGRVEDLTIEELQALDAGSWFSHEYAGERIPTLEEFLEELTPTNSRALIELKGVWNEEQTEHAAQLLRERYLVDRVAFESFEIENLEQLESIAPEFARVMLTREWNSAVLTDAAALNVSAVGARNKVFKENFPLIEDARELGIGTMIYTLNTEESWNHAKDRGIDLIITDDPVTLEEWRRERTDPASA